MPKPPDSLFLQRFALIFMMSTSTHISEGS